MANGAASCGTACCELNELKRSNPDDAGAAGLYPGALLYALCPVRASKEGAC